MAAIIPFPRPAVPRKRKAPTFAKKLPAPLDISPTSSIERSKMPFDVVQKAEHYNRHPSGVECITVVRHFTFNCGNVVKYLWRAGLKGGSDKRLEDLRKARFYLNDEIAVLEAEAAALKS